MSSADPKYDSSLSAVQLHSCFSRDEPSKSELKKRAKAAEKEKKAAEKAAKLAEQQREKAEAEEV